MTHHGHINMIKVFTIYTLKIVNTLSLKWLKWKLGGGGRRLKALNLLEPIYNCMVYGCVILFFYFWDYCDFMASAKEKTKKLLEMMQEHLDDFIFEEEPIDLPSLVEGLDIYAKYMTLKQVDWNRAEAADLLGLKRGTMREWVLRHKEKLGIPASKGKPRGNTNKPSPYTGHGPKNIKRRKKQLDPEYCDWLDDRYGT